MKTYQIKVLAGLDKSASAAQIKSDLAQLNKAKNRVNLVGQMDREATKKNVNATLKKLKDSEIKITGVLDGSATASNIQKSLQNVHDVTAKADVEVKGAEQVDNLRKKMDGAGDSASGMAAKLYLARTALQMLRRTVHEAISTVQELDEAATSLALATGSGSDEAYKLLAEYNDMAKRLGSTTTQISDAATEWLRQGKSAAETSALIEQSMVLSKVGAMDAAEATKNLTSTMKGFKLEVADVAGVVDRLTAIDLKAAVTSADLATAVARTASSANLAGVGLDKLLGYVTVVEETTQKSAETIGESFKTIFARMGNVKLGKFLDDDGEDLSDTEKILNNFGIALRKSNDEFREFDDVLDEVASRWSDFTNVEQSAIATTIAGTRQRENFLVLMENYGKALEYTGVAANSAGTALQKFAAYEDSIEAKTASFVAAMESLTMDTIDSGLVKDLISASTALVEFIEKAGLLRATLLSLGAGATLKGVKLIATGFKNVSQHVLNMGEAVNILRRVGDVSALSGEQIKRLGTLTKGLSDSQLKLILSSQNLSTAQMKAILQASGLTSAEAAQKLQTLGLATAQQTTAGATWSLTAALNGLKVAIMSNPIGALMTAVAAATVVFSLISNAIEDAKQKEEEARQKMLEVADAAKEEADAISNLYDAYTQANKAYQDGVGSKDDLTSATDSLLESLGYEKSAVGDLITEYGTLEKAIDGVTKKSLEQKANSILEGYDAAKQAALSAAEDSMGWFSGSTITVKTNGDDKKFAELLQKAGYLGNGDLPLLSTSLYTGINNYGDIDTLVEGYEKLLAIKELLESGIGNGYSAEELSGAGVYTDVVAKINAVSEEIEAYRDIIKAYNEAQAQIAYMNFAEANGVPETREEYNALKQSLLDAADASGKYIGSQEEIEAAITNMLATRPALQEFFTASTETAEGISLYKAQLSELTDVISALQSSYNALDAVQADMADGGGLSPETIEKLAKAEANYLDYIYEENGVVKLNTEAWKENANAKMLGEIKAIQNEIDSLEEQNATLKENVDLYKEKVSATDSIDEMNSYLRLIDEDTEKLNANTVAIKENQAKLAIYSSLYGSITGDLDAYTAALRNFSNVANSIDSITGSFQTLANLQAEVANGFTISLDKALEFAKVYPEILNSARATADGQIVLNKGVVNSFIKGKKAELDAQIDASVAELEVEKAANQAKLESAQAQLELAKAVAEGEGDIAKELAEYRINAGNAVAQAMIDANVDEATAFKLAAVAMAQNAEEFDRVAMEVCTDVNGNFNQAAYDLAQTMYTNLTNVKTDLASVAKQAHETAKAIAGIEKGDSSAGSTNIQGGSGGGTGGSGIKLNLTSGSFEGTEYTYTAKESNLEDFISQIELDISNYQNAISQIDGQIAALQALKNTPLKKFAGSGTGSGSGGSSSSTKEVEEYIASIDEYREAVERLRKAQEEADKLETAIDNAGSFEKKIELQKKLIAAYQEEQEALHSLNNARDDTITQGVEALRGLGFSVEYDSDTNDLWISNMEHLNELTADSKGKYDTLQEATNALREDTESLIDTITDLNDSNRDGSETWWELANSIHEANIAIYESMVKASENEIMLNSNWLDNAIASGNTEGIQEYTSSIIEQYKKMQDTVHAEAEYYRSKGYSDTSDEVSKLSDLWWDYEQNIRDAINSTYDAITNSLGNKITLTENWLEQAISGGDTSGIAKYTDDIVSYYRQMQENIHKQAQALRDQGYADDSDEVSRLSDLWWEYEQNIKDATISSYETIRNASENQLGLTQTHLEQAMNRGDLDSVSRHTDEVVGLYRQMQENVHRQADYYRSKGDAETSDEIRQLSALWWEYENNIRDAMTSAYEAVVGSLDNKLKLTDNWMNKAIANEDLSGVKRWANEIVAINKAKQEALHQQAEYYRSLGDEDTSDRVSELSDAWYDCADNIKAAKQAVIDYLINVVDAASDSVDEIRSVSDTLYAAADEFAANDGFITIDTWNALRKVGTQYMQMLKDENGLWEINEERINDVIAARTRQLAVENAMSYVERLKLAAQEGSIEDLDNLCFATTNATNSTWGLVYAELELMHTMGELNDSQYQAALHNIQVMQDLANNVVANIGKATDAVAKNLEATRKQLEDTKKGLQDLLDELEDMEDGANDLVKYVMDMLKHRIQQQIDLLEEMKDKYSEIIELKKKSLDATKDEQDYQKTIAKKLKEMAKLQERINALALDDSRSAQAERAKLLEQMAELQEDLADTQADKSIEAQKEALDKMEEDYHAEKDEEIKILENSISSTQKLYSMAISYIRENWNTLYSELISWNTEYGTSLNSEIDAAWEAAQAAAQRYGDFVSAVMGGISAEIDNITKQIEALDEQMSNLSINASSGGGVVGGTDTGNKNTTVGNRTEHASPTNEDMVRTIVGRMKEYGAAWNKNNDKAANDALHQKAADLAKQLDQYGVHADFRDSDGTWWITQDKLNPSNVGKLLHSCYHTGGFVGDEPLKPNERYIKAENGELVLTSDQQDSFAVQIDRIGAMTEKFMSTPLSMEQPILPDFSHLSNSTINNVMNSSSSQPVTINQGDVVIQGVVMGPEQLAKNINPYIEVSRKMANELGRMMTGWGKPTMMMGHNEWR